MARLWLTQVNALLVKNLLTAKRSPLFPLIVLLFPPLLSAILVSFHANHNSSADSSAVTRPSPTPISQLHFNCNTTGKCPVLFYAPNDAYHTSIMARLASMTGMKVGESMTGFATYDDMSVAFFENAGELTSPDLYFAAIAWTSEDVVPGAKFPNVTAYNVWEDSGPPVEYQEGMGHILKRNRNENPEFAKNIGLQIALESAAVSVISELSRGGAPISAMMDVSIDWLNVGPKTGKPEPVTPNFESTDWSSRTRNEAYNAPLTFFIPLYPIVLFCYTLYSVCREKQDDHLVSMKMMGLHESSFWVSSAVIPLVLNFFSTMASALILILAGGFVGWPLLQSIDVPSMWLLQFSFGCSMIATALFLSSIVMKTSSAYGTVVVYFIIHCAVPAPVFGTPAWLPHIGHTAVHILTLLFVPVLTFGKVWFEVINTAMPTVMNSYKPTNLTLSTTFSNPHGPVYKEDLYYENEDFVVSAYGNLPSIGFSLMTMIVAVGIAVVLACYIDLVFGGPYDGLLRPWHFPFTSGFWSGKTGRIAHKTEADQTLQSTSASLGTVEIARLTKDSGRAGFSNMAIDIPRLTLEKGSCCVFLGVKGSGKTTAIKTVTGMNKPTAGSAFFGGLDIHTDAPAIRSKIGLCSQGDSLYVNLTAAEHVQFYAKLRGVDPALLGIPTLRGFELDVLRRVELDSFHDTLVSEFTNGMRCRLSLLLATIGPDVQFIFLDEITAGQDGFTRQVCWKYIKELKEQKIVFLTTSSTEEAETLGDLVCVLVKGKMAASGSQTFLRSGFCRGYLVRLRASGQTSHQAPEMLAAPQSTFGNSVSAPFNVFRGISNQVSNDVEMQGIRPPTVTSLLETWVKECIPNCEVLLMEAEKLDIHVPMSSSHHLRPLLRALENDNTETVEWTISSMALQEVFAKFIAGKAKFMAPDNLASFSSQQSSTQIAICSVCQQTFEPLPNMGSRVTCSRCSALEASKRDSKLPPYIDFAQFCLLHGSVVVRRQASAEIANQPPIPRRKRSLVGALLPVLIANQRLQMCLTITICTLLLPMVLLFGFLSNNPERPLLSTLTDCKGFIIESKYRITCDPKDLTAAMFQTAVAPQNFSKATKLGACTAKNPASCYPITFSGLPSDSALFSVITERGVQPYGIQPDDTQYLYRGFIRQPDTSMEFIRRVLNAAVPRLRFWYSDPSLGPRFEEFASPTLFLFNETVNFGDTIPSLLAGGATNADEYGDGLLRTVESYPALFSRVDDVASVFSTRQNEVNSTSLTLPAECSAQYGQTGLVGFAASNFSDVASKFRDIFPTFGITFTSLPTRGSVNPPSFTFHSYGIKQSSPARLYLSASPETSVGQAFLVGPPFYTQFRYSNLTTYGLPVRCLEFSKNLPTEYYEANSALQVTISSMTNQWLRSLSNATSAPLVRGQSFKLPPISRVSRPYTAWIGLEFFSLLITALMLPRMVDLIVQDKSKGAYELMRMQTGTIIHYWIGNYIYGFWATYGLCSLMTGCVILTRSELYAMVGVLEMLGIMLVWAHCVVGLSFLLSGIFQRPVTAAIASCFAVAIISLVPFMAPNTQINGIPEGGLPMLYLLFPPFGIVSLTRSLYSSFTRGNIMGFVVTQTLFTFVVGTLYGFLGIYLQFIRRTSGGFGLDPMLGLHATKNKGVTLEDGATYELTYGENIRNEENAIMGSLQNQTSDQALTCVRLRGKDVRNVSFRISSGEVFGLLGPSGGGKSTILKMVSGLLRPPQGEIYFNGRSLKEILSRGDLGKYVGICPQKSLLWPDITVQRHLMVFAQMRGYPANQSLTKYAHHIARSVGLEASLKVAAKFLSVGAQRLLGIGIAITGDPTLVILDEPTLGLDPATRQYIWKVIEMLKLSPTSTGQPRSILIATSAQDEAEMLCDKVMVLSKGSANGYGSPSQLRHRFGDTLQLSLLYSVDALLTISAQPTRAEEAESITTMKTAEHVRIDMVLQKIRDVVSPTAYVESTIPTDFHAVFASFQRGQEPGTLPPVRVFWTVRTALAVARERDLGAMFVHLESAAQSLSVQSWELKPRSFNDASVKLSGV